MSAPSPTAGAGDLRAPGQIAHEARFAGRLPRYWTPWRELPADARDVWVRIEMACQARLSAENATLIAERDAAVAESLSHQRVRSAMLADARKAERRATTAETRLAALQAKADRLRVENEKLRQALRPFAAITSSTLYLEDGSDREGYSVLLSDPADDADFCGDDLALARDALATAPAQDMPDDR